MHCAFVYKISWVDRRWMVDEVATCLFCLLLFILAVCLYFRVSFLVFYVANMYMYIPTLCTVCTCTETRLSFTVHLSVLQRPVLPLLVLLLSLFAFNSVQCFWLVLFFWMSKIMVNGWIGAVVARSVKIVWTTACDMNAML